MYEELIREYIQVRSRDVHEITLLVMVVESLVRSAIYPMNNR